MRRFISPWMIALLGWFPVVLADTSVPVGVVTASTRVIAEEIALHGSLIARRVSRVSSDVEGLVAEILVDDGDVVEHGQLLLRLDSRLAEIAVDAARARLDEAQARHQEAGRRHQELARLKTTQHAAETAVAAAAAQIRIDLAQVKQAEAGLAQQQELLRRHRVRAPFSAVVRSKLVEQGEWLETSTAIIELVDLDVLRLEVPVPQIYFSSISRNSAVEVRLDALPGQAFDAVVSRKIPVGDAESRTFRVRIDLENQQRQLAPGMSARVVLSLDDDSLEPALVLPRDAVVRNADGSNTVWVVERRDAVNKAEPKPVQLGRSYRQWVEVIDGSSVQPGDLVIVRGNEILRPGQSVSVAEEISAEH